MSLPNSHSIASRLGVSLGRGMRFLLTDENSILRWIKRTFVVAAAILTIFHIGHGFISGLLTFAVLVILTFMLVKAGGTTDIADQGKNSGTQLSKSKSLWDSNGPDSLWHGEDERVRR